jgi:hypothetical protein
MPVIKCSNGKWRIGSGSCIYETREKAVEVWQAILSSGQYGQIKISYDYDDVLTRDEYLEKAIKDVKNGATVYVISARHSKEDLVHLSPKIGIPTSRIFATGSNKAKVEKILELGISKHYDNNKDVIDALNKSENQIGILVER